MFECQSWSVSHSAGIQLDRHPAALLMSCLWCISCSICLCYCCCCTTFVCPIIMSFWCSTRTVSLKCIPNGIEGGKFNQNQLYSHSLLLFRFEFDEWAHGMASPAHNSLHLVSSRTHERINLFLWSPYIQCRYFVSTNTGHMWNKTKFTICNLRSFQFDASWTLNML